MGKGIETVKDEKYITKIMLKEQILSLCWVND